MRAFLIVAISALIAVGCGGTSSTRTPEGGELPHSILDPYLKIHEALAADSTDGIRQNAGAIATAAASLGAPAVKVDTSAVQLAAAGDIADARGKFGQLSDAIDAYMTGFELTTPEGVRKAFCPMVRKPWLQAGSVMKNPYYGTAMSTCGEFR
ncbi:MAG: DUF3347 domain-containing protein [Acidobacteria bacterium]|nr:DUF3347 domain-containing protein [Acidobacteriota bacterium]